MIRGLYAAASGMLAGLVRQDAVANNLANVNTPGYKRDVAVTAAFPSVLLRRLAGPAFGGYLGWGRGGPVLGRVGLGAAVAGTIPVLEPGQMRATGVDTDLAIEGDGWFRVETARGERYTRQGNLRRDAEGRLVTAAGDPILGEAGPITVGPGTFEVDAGGGVWVDGEKVGRLSLVRLDAAALEREGAGLYRLADGAPPPEPASGATVRQGYLEGANVDLVGTMVEMLAVFRAYEASQKAVTAADNVLGRAVNDIGRV